MIWKEEGCISFIIYFWTFLNIILFRQIALKALSERLSKSAPQKQSTKTLLPLHAPSTSKQQTHSSNVTPQVQLSVIPPNLIQKTEE